MVVPQMATSGARALNPWKFCLAGQQHDVRKLVSAFETVGESTAERDLRIQHLQKAGSVTADALAEKLRSCAPNAPCLSASCPICYRRLRRWLVGAAASVFGNLGLISTTLIPTNEDVAAPELQTLSPKRLNNMLRQQLNRVNSGQTIMIGGIDG